MKLFNIFFDKIPTSKQENRRIISVPAEFGKKTNPAMLKSFETYLRESGLFSAETRKYE